MNNDIMNIIRNIAYTALASALALSCGKAEKVTPDVIPYPNSTELSASSVNFDRISRIEVIDSALLPEAGLLRDALEKLGRSVTISSEGDASGAVVLRLDPAAEDEAYSLRTSRKSAEISGGRAGVFYGAQTLLQELRNGKVRQGTITDSPRYAWRGFMLDEARHFFGKDRVKRLIDMMAYFKLNRFHWHLTDAQGWRIEIKSYPRLGEIGGRGCHSDPETAAQYYSQRDIREIVAYAAERHIEIIPEIDMPGHASAANRAYPEYNGGGTPQFADFTFNVGKEETYAYLTAILREVAGLFPSEYIHIGGDEVFYGSDAWNSDPYVRRMMKREGLETIKDAEGYFISRMTDSVKVLGKKVIGWDDMLDFPLDKEENIICWWRHDRPQSLRKSLAEGYSTILCPRKPMYFDFVQDSTHKCGRVWDGFCPLEDVYAFPDAWYDSWNVTEKDMTPVLGIQANLWTELVHNADRFDFMIWPRLCAVAESAWTMPENKSYDSFSSRMESVYDLFMKMGIYYFDPRDPSHHPEPDGPVIRKKGDPQPRRMDYRD